MFLNPKQKELVKSGGDIAKAGEKVTHAAMSNVSVLWYPSRVVPWTIKPALGKFYHDILHFSIHL